MIILLQPLRVLGLLACVTTPSREYQVPQGPGPAFWGHPLFSFLLCSPLRWAVGRCSFLGIVQQSVNMSLEHQDCQVHILALGTDIRLFPGTRFRSSRCPWWLTKASLGSYRHKGNLLKGIRLLTDFLRRLEDIQTTLKTRSSWDTTVILFPTLTGLVAILSVTAQS